MPCLSVGIRIVCWQNPCCTGQWGHTIYTSRHDALLRPANALTTIPCPVSDDVEFSFARSGGAGGQNVNKVNTKVDMRFCLDKQGWVPDEVKEAIRRMVGV